MTAEELRALNPFPGLRAYSTEEADVFFGREAHVESLVRAVDESAFVAVSGASGCGKSSIVLAGLFKALAERSKEAGGAAYRTVVLRPGRSPIARLATQLQRALDPSPSAEAAGALYGRLRLSAVGLVEAVRMARLVAGERVVVVVDQFEEIFRFERMSDPEEGAAFIKLLLRAADEAGSVLRIVITLRSDALGSCAHFPGLAEAVSRGLVLVPKPTRDERKRAIVGPVERRGFTIRPSLVQRILNDISDNFDDLPVMQHALHRTWWHWAGTDPTATGTPARAIEVGDYEAIGGCREALDRHGRDLLAALPPRLLPVAARVMRALTERRPDGTEVRRPLAFDELCGVVDHDRDAVAAEVAAVVDHLRGWGASFLMPPPTERLQDNPAIDISHESLIRLWSELRGWVNAEAAARDMLDQLLQAAQRWSLDKTEVWSGRALQEALDWQARERPGAAWVQLCRGKDSAVAWKLAQSFLQACQAEAAMRRRRTVWRRATLGLTAFAGIVALGVTGQSMLLASRSSEQRLSQELSMIGWQSLRIDPSLSAHVAMAALDRNPGNPQAENVLRWAAEALKVAHTESIFEFGVPIADARPNRAGTHVALVGGNRLAVIAVDRPAERAQQSTLPWSASNVWLLDERGLIVLQSEQDGVRVQTVAGQTLADWNCPGGRGPDHVYAAQVSSDGRWLAAGCMLGQIALWALPARAGPLAPPRLLAGAGGATVSALAFSKDGEWLAAGDSVGQSVLWKLAEPAAPWVGRVVDGRFVSPIAHGSTVRDIDVWQGAQGSFVATASDDGRAVVWKLDTARRRLAEPVRGSKVRWTLEHGRPVLRARIDRDGRLLTIADTRVQFWTDETPLPGNARHNAWINDADVSPGAGLAVSASDDGVARLWSRERGLVATLIGHRDSVTRSRFVSDDRIVTASRDGTLRLWRVAPAVRTLHTAAGRWIFNVAPSPDGKELAICGEMGTVDNAHCGLLALGSGPDDAAEAPASIPIAIDRNIGTEAGGTLFDTRVDAVTDLFWSADGARLMASGRRFDIFSSTALSLGWTRAPGAVMGNRPGGVVMAHSAKRGESVRAGASGSLRIESGSGATVGEFRSTGRTNLSVAALSEDGRWLAAADDKVVQLFDRRVPDGAPRPLAGHLGSVLTLAFSPDGRMLASAGNDRSARIWSLGDPAGRLMLELSGGHSAAIYRLAFNRRGDQLATAGADGTVRIWDAFGGRELAVMEWHSAAINDLRFHPTDDRMFTASDDGTVRQGICRTCGLPVAELRRWIELEGLAPLTPRDADYVRRAASKGARAER